MESKHGYHLAMLISLHRINSLKSQVQHFTMTLIYMYTSSNEGALNEGDLLNLDIKGANKPAQTNKTNKKKDMFKCKKKMYKKVTETSNNHLYRLLCCREGQCSVKVSRVLLCSQSKTVRLAGHLNQVI